MIRWKSEPSLPSGKAGVTRGCRIPYPRTTRPRASLKSGRLSGCAILPISRKLASRGNLVSASSVITNRTSAGTCGGPSPVGTKVVSVAPRSSRLSSCSLPRLRSQPIHLPSDGFNTRRRCNNRKRSPLGAAPCRSLRSFIASAAKINRASSPSTTSWSASFPSVSRAKAISPPAPLRKCTSSRSICSRRSASPVSSVGTATSVRNFCGTPSRRARPGKVTGPKLHVMARLTSAVATSVAGKKPMRANNTSKVMDTPGVQSSSSDTVIRATATSKIVPT